jgi:hypothetical protein
VGGVLKSCIKNTLGVLGPETKKGIPSKSEEQLNKYDT